MCTCVCTSRLGAPVASIPDAGNSTSAFAVYGGGAASARTTPSRSAIRDDREEADALAPDRARHAPQVEGLLVHAGTPSSRSSSNVADGFAAKARLVR